MNQTGIESFYVNACFPRRAASTWKRTLATFVTRHRGAGAIAPPLVGKMTREIRGGVRAWIISWCDDRRFPGELGFIQYGRATLQMPIRGLP